MIYILSKQQGVKTTKKQAKDFDMTDMLTLHYCQRLDQIAWMGFYEYQKTCNSHETLRLDNEYINHIKEKEAKVLTSWPCGFIEVKVSVGMSPVAIIANLHTHIW